MLYRTHLSTKYCSLLVYSSVLRRSANSVSWQLVLRDSQHQQQAAKMSYNYTKPRGPIFAMYTGPGPNLVLPTLIGTFHHDPRSMHRKMPAYFLGLLCPIKYKRIGPGPAAYNTFGIFKDGLYTPPKWSLAPRLLDLIPFLTPAPGTYSPENCMAISYETPPEYSFGLRHPQVRMDNIPGNSQLRTSVSEFYKSIFYFHH